MNFIITEDEYNALGDARGQLNLVSCLLTAKGSDSALFDASDLCSFLSAQVEALQRVEKGIDARYAAARNQDAVLTCADWATIMKTISGRGRLTQGELKAMGRKLEKCVEANPEMRDVFNAWKDVLTDGGTLPFNLEPNSLDGFIIAFEQLVPAMAKPPTTVRKREKLTTAKARTAVAA